MAAQSVTGTGHGSSDKPTVLELSTLSNGPTIYLTGYVEAEDLLVSPASIGNTVVFPYSLTGGSENYVVLLTTQNSGYAYVNEFDEDEDGNFSGFSFITETEGTLMYLVASVGIKPVVSQ